MATSEHTASVVVKGETSGAVKGLKEVKDATTSAKKATNDLDDAQAGLGKRLEGIEDRFNKMNGTLGKVTSLLGAGGLVAAAGAAVQALGVMVDRAAEVDGVYQALKLNIDQARASTMGMVSDFELARTANKALQLGVVKNSEEFARLTSTAAKLGLAMGQSVSQSVDDLTTGLGRQSVMILDNLGIILKVEEANEIYAQRIGKVASALSDAEKKQAFMTVALERAEQAAEKAGVKLDSSAASVQSMAASWANFKDTASEVGTTILGALVRPLTYAQELTTQYEANIARLTDSIAKLDDQLEHHLTTATRWDKTLEPLLETLGYLDNVTRRMSKEDRDEGIAALTAAYAARTEEASKAAEAAKNAKLLEASNAKKGGKKGPSLSADPLDRFADQTFGVDASDDLFKAKQQQEYNEEFGREIELREMGLEALEQEIQLRQQMVDLGLADAAQVEELNLKKYDSEQALLDMQMHAASTREAIFEVESAKRRKAAQEQLRVQAQTQAAEIKSLQMRQAAYEKYGGAAADVLGNVMIASIEAANGEQGAAAVALKAVADGIRNQMILVSLKEFALAVASAASYNYPAAAQHATAGGLAAAAAAAAGGVGAAIGTAIPPEPKVAKESGSGGGSGGGAGGSGGGDDDGTPTSYYDSDLWQRRPDRMGRQDRERVGRQDVSIVVHGSIIGGTREDLGTELRKLIQSSERAGRKVYA